MHALTQQLLVIERAYRLYRKENRPKTDPDMQRILAQRAALLAQLAAWQQ